MVDDGFQKCDSYKVETYSISQLQTPNSKLPIEYLRENTPV
jgi:hypothetical protein